VDDVLGVAVDQRTREGGHIPASHNNGPNINNQLHIRAPPGVPHTHTMREALMKGASIVDDSE
jgi:hypothetical protein